MNINKKSLIFCLILLLISSSNVFAGNPFIPQGGINENKELPLVKGKLPSIPSFINEKISTGSNAALTEKSNWSVVGIVDDNVILNDARNNTKTVKNGTHLGKCIVVYPNILCGLNKDNYLKNLSQSESEEKSRKGTTQILDIRQVPYSYQFEFARGLVGQTFIIYNQIKQK